MQEEKTQSPLQIFTNNTLQQIHNATLTLQDMPLSDLKKYRTGLNLYRPQLEAHIQHVKSYIEEKKSAKKRAPTTAQKSTNYWAGMGSSFFGFLQSLLPPTQSAKSETLRHVDSNGYQSLSLQEQNVQDSVPSTNGSGLAGTLCSLSRCLRPQNNKNSKDKDD